jgi:hypothetical protein
MDSAALFKRLAWGLSALILALFVFVTFVISRPDAYEEHLAQPLPGVTWPDGSPRTANDWWTHPASISHAQSKATPAPQGG